MLSSAIKLLWKPHEFLSSVYINKLCLKFALYKPEKNNNVKIRTKKKQQNNRKCNKKNRKIE